MQTILWTKCLRYECNGPANKVLNQCTIPLDPSKWTNNSVLVRWLASPINPLDLNIIEGRYALISPKLPAIAGTEAIGIVERVGLDVRNLKCGQRVIRFRMPLSSDSDASNGVWTELGIYPSDVLLPINPKIDLISAATLAINPPTALALLCEFIPLKKGDWIIQNAANSGVGRAVIQLAKVYGYKTLNLIRNRPNVDELKAELHLLGADLVMTEEEFGIKLREINSTENALPKPLLALNGTGGRSALLIASALGRNGILVTYELSATNTTLNTNGSDASQSRGVGFLSGMSKRPVEIGTGAFIFNGICAKGFSLGTWIMENDVEKVAKMFAELQEFILNGKLRPPPAKIVPMQKYTEAIENAISHGTKQILLLSDNQELRRNNKI